MNNSTAFSSKTKRDNDSDSEKFVSVIQKIQNKINTKKEELEENERIANWKLNRKFYPSGWGYYIAGHHFNSKLIFLVADLIGIAISLLILFIALDKGEVANALFLFRKFEGKEFYLAVASMVCLLLFVDLINNIVNFTINTIVMKNLFNDKLSENPIRTDLVRYSIFAGFDVFDLILMLGIFLRFKSNFMPKMETFSATFHSSVSSALSLIFCTVLWVFFFGSLIFCAVKILLALKVDKKAKENSKTAIENIKNIKEEITSLEESLSESKAKRIELYEMALNVGATNEEAQDELMLQAAELECIPACVYTAKRLLNEYTIGYNYSKKEKEDGFKLALAFAQIAAKAGDNDGKFIELYIDSTQISHDLNYFRDALEKLKAYKSNKLINDEELLRFLDTAIRVVSDHIYDCENQISNWTDNTGYNQNYIYGNNDSSYMGFSSKGAYDTATDLFGMEVQNNMFGGGIDASGM